MGPGGGAGGAGSAKIGSGAETGPGGKGEAGVATEGGVSGLSERAVPMEVSRCVGTRNREGNSRDRRIHGHAVKMP